MTENTEEAWKDVPGYEGLYQVSNLGRARSLPRVSRFIGRWGNGGTTSRPGESSRSKGERIRSPLREPL